MFRGRDRLSRTDFPIALATGKRFTSPHFILVVAKKVTGYAVVVPKKVAKLSVTRHLLKRRITEILKEKELPETLIVFCRPGLDGVSYGDMKNELHTLLATIYP